MIEVVHAALLDGCFGVSIGWLDGRVSRCERGEEERERKKTKRRKRQNKRERIMAKE